MPPADPSLRALEARLGYAFRTPGLLQRALTHPSFIQQHPTGGEHNQRLEFLGDAVLGLILAEKLFEILPTTREGVLTRNRSALVKGVQLAALAQQLDLPRHLRLSQAELQQGGHERESTLEDAFEALVGAIYLDSDYATARSVVLGWYGDLLTRLADLLETHNPKGQLQELVQPTLGNEAISYEVVGESGPDHAKRFHVAVEVAGRRVGEGMGPSKKEAEENAARAALRQFHDEGAFQPE